MKKIALVTGASRGIGLAISQHLMDQGYYVVGTTRSQKSADKLTQCFNGQGQGRVFDSTQLEQVDSWVQEVAQLGQLYILVNNAGITSDALSLRMSDQAWEQVLKTNLEAPFYFSRAALKQMLPYRSGRIVNITSVLGSISTVGQANYCAAKSGLNGLTRALATEMASRGITVNAVAPGFIDTDMTKALDPARTDAILKMIPMGRMGDPKDVAHMVGFLVDEQSSYITGQVFHVNGGLYMS